MGIRVLASAALLLVVVTGCSAARADRVVEPSATGLPVDAFSFDAEQTGLVLRARSFLVADCLRAAGTPVDAEAEQRSVVESTRDRIADFGLDGNARRYGVTTAEHASRYGYHLIARASAPRREPAEGERRCAAEADAVLAPGGSPGDADVVRSANAGTFRESLTSPEVTAAFTAWAGCMKAAGHAATTPAEAGSGFDLGTAEATAAEIAEASADVACKESTGVVAVWRGFEVARQRELVDRRSDEFDRARAARDAVLDRASAVVADHS